MTKDVDCPPTRYVTWIAGQFPDLWRIADQYREQHLKDAWPPGCFMPVAGWYEVLCKTLGVERLHDKQAPYAIIAATLGAWRVSQGIYRFDPTLYEALVSTEISGDIPHQVLFHLPEWCV